MTESPRAGTEALDGALEEAGRLSEQGAYPAALELLLELEPEHPREPTLLCAIGSLAFHLGADGVAADFYRRCLEQRPEDPHVLAVAGGGLAVAGDPEAEPALRLAALTAPDLPLARLNYGAFLSRAGLLEEALAELAAAHRLTPEDPVVLRELGIALHLAGRMEAALEAIEAATTCDPDDVELQLLLALLLLEAEETSRAAEELHRAAGEFGEAGEVQLLAALLAALEGWEEEAWLALSRAEAAPGVDPASVREVEEVLESGGDAIRELLLEQLAPALLRDRIQHG